MTVANKCDLEEWTTVCSIQSQVRK